MKKIGIDINYPRIMLEKVFRCKICGHQLNMFGCSNILCINSDENLKGATNESTDTKNI